MTYNALQWIRLHKVPKVKHEVRWALSAVRDAITSAGRPTDPAVAAEIAEYARALDLVVRITKNLEDAPIIREPVRWRTSSDGSRA